METADKLLQTTSANTLLPTSCASVLRHSVSNADDALWLQKAYGYATPERVSTEVRRYIDASKAIISKEEYLKITSCCIPQERKAEIEQEIAELRQTVALSKPYTISIASLKREDEEKTKAFLMLEFVKLNVRLHLKNPLSSEDMEFISDIIMRDYPGLKVVDFSIFIENICRGRYGQFYERLDSTKILSALDTFYDNTLNANYEKNLSEHMSIVSDIAIEKEQRRRNQSYRDARSMAEAISEAMNVSNAIIEDRNNGQKGNRKE